MGCDQSKYNKINKYIFVDSSQIHRLKELDNVLKKYFGNYYNCESIKDFLNNGEKNILDIRCGIGKWCEDINNEFPGNKIKGINNNTEILEYKDNYNIIYEKVNMGNIKLNEKY